MKAKDLKQILSSVDDDADVCISLWDSQGMKAIAFNLLGDSRTIKTAVGDFVAIGHADHCPAYCHPEIYPDDDPAPSQDPDKKEVIGYASIAGKQKPIYSIREIKRGRNKGKMEVEFLARVDRYRKVVVPAASILDTLNQKMFDCRINPAQ